MEAIDFDKIYSMFDGLIVDLCKQCNGLCEKTQLALFLPGEIEHISNKMNLSPEEFKNKYVTVVPYKNNSINLMKLGLCPFLNTKFKCELETLKSKPLICRLYPLWIGLKGNSPTLFNDTQLCPNANKISFKFKRQAKKIFKRIQHKIPNWFLEFESQIDDSLFDYSKFEQYKDRKEISLLLLEECKFHDGKYIS